MGGEDSNGQVFWRVMIQIFPKRWVDIIFEGWAWPGASAGEAEARGSLEGEKSQKALIRSRREEDEAFLTPLRGRLGGSVLGQQRQRGKHMAAKL